MKKMKALEEENARLKRIIVNQAIDIDRLKELSTKNGNPFRPQVRLSVLAPGGKFSERKASFPFKILHN